MGQRTNAVRVAVLAAVLPLTLTACSDWPSYAARRVADTVEIRVDSCTTAHAWTSIRFYRNHLDNPADLLWTLTANPKQLAADITYGQVPVGFHQAQVPPPLNFTQALLVEFDSDGKGDGIVVATEPARHHRLPVRQRKPGHSQEPQQLPVVA